MRFFVVTLLFFNWHGISNAQKKITVDICVYGASSGGVIAAYTAARLGKKVILISPERHLGGLSSGGLGNTDIGNKIAITGLARDFYRRVGLHYGKPEQWIFEPHVAENIFKDYVREAGVPVLFHQYIQKVYRSGTRISKIQTSDPDSRSGHSDFIISAKQYIDCSYEGDLMARASVLYTVGREDNKIYNENYNGVQLLDKHQFPDGVDPYIIPGNPKSGLLWGITNEPLLPNGSGDRKVQAYNFRLCLTDSIPNQIAITRPDDYDSTKYLLLLRYIQVKNPGQLEEGILNINLMPARKTDINNNGPFSTDMIGMNYSYPESDFRKRNEIIRSHEMYIKGLLYFLGHDENVPVHLRNEMLRWGYPRD